MTYQLLTEAAFYTYENKKSLFHAAAYPIASRTEAMDSLAKEKLSYPDARHHCWAYLLGSPQQPSNQGYNDDGEPSGTAGKPILNVINHSDYGDIMIVISRYFGGVKLGAGGLVRAYSQATKHVLQNTQTTLLVKRQRYHIVIGFSQESSFRQLALKLNIELENITYDHSVQIWVGVPCQNELAFLDWCHHLQIPKVNKNCELN